MAGPVSIRVVIRGSRDEGGAPSVEDMAAQIRDAFQLFARIEQRLHQGQSEIEWRITAASMSSPLVLKCTAFPRRHGYDVSNLAARTRATVLSGVSQLEERAERPPYFGDEELALAREVFGRVANGLSRSEFVELDGEREGRRVVIAPRAAESARHHIDTILPPDDELPLQAVTAEESTDHVEYGSIEGVLLRADTWYGKPAFRIRSDAAGKDVTCLPSGELVESWGRETSLDELWSGQRVIASGLLRYSGTGELKYAQVEQIERLRTAEAIPRAEDIFDRNFTGSLHPVDYLEKLRDGEIS